jgi:hypothetical protein
MLRPASVAVDTTRGVGMLRFALLPLALSAIQFGNIVSF